MNEKLKQRLVGAVVLVSLAVIFIPMLLDGGERSSMPMFGSNIPKRPDYQFEPLEIPLQSVSPIDEQRPVLIDKPEPVPAPAEPAPAPPGAVKSPAAPKPAATESTATESAVSPNATAWVVQVGSFSQSSNALALRDRLRRNGFTAFVERLNTGKDTVYRVRVGPELKRESAEKQRKRLQRELKLKGIVMEHEA